MSADDWIAALRAECARTSQIDVARRLGVSNTMVNQVLKGTYKGNWTGIETRFKGEFQGQTVACPVLGDISTRKCLDWQAKPFATTNSLRMTMYTACRECPNRRNKS